MGAELALAPCVGNVVTSPHCFPFPPASALLQPWSRPTHSLSASAFPERPHLGPCASPSLPSVAGPFPAAWLAHSHSPPPRSPPSTPSLKQGPPLPAALQTCPGGPPLRSSPDSAPNSVYHCTCCQVLSASFWNPGRINDTHLAEV